ncbi:uncharacterized protein PRCAT00000345001 [Priceomyces carsonii]|uniref:uncharacterized protein n=1 Tax=Priceomyces carsonii TaxID=28549 RepID=UPI002ED9B750|nr:unnamed protein product [Priceomyces carsonii]
MSHRIDNDSPSEPPPSYDEVISESKNNSYHGLSTPDSDASYSRPSLSVPPPRPTRPPARPPRPSSVLQVDSQRPEALQASSSSSLYGNSANLPFHYTRGYFCQKCKNTGYKIKNGKICRDCWQKFYLNDNSYNPNPELPFKYPRRYLCEKCQNTGYKLRNGKTCKDCWEMFSPRNPYNAVSSSGLLDSFFGSTTEYIRPTNFVGQSNLPPVRVPPGDPRLGGILCGRCRGSGLVHFFLDEDLCPVCHGLGRIIGPSGPPRSQVPLGPPQGYFNQGNGGYVPPRKN